MLRAAAHLEAGHAEDAVAVVSQLGWMGVQGAAAGSQAVWRLCRAPLVAVVRLAGACTCCHVSMLTVYAVLFRRSLQLLGRRQKLLKGAVGAAWMLCLMCTTWESSFLPGICCRCCWQRPCTGQEVFAK